jgi:hypothetical protein
MPKVKKLAPLAVEADPFIRSSAVATASHWLNEQLAAAVKPVFVAVELTPALAEVLLDRNPQNRKVSPTRVSQLARDIRNNAWKFNGEAIIVSTDGLLNDGQHRCAAVLEAGQPIQTLMVIGVERDSRDTVDHGAIRSPGDDLALHGYTNTACLAASARFLWRWHTYGFIEHSGQTAPTRADLIRTVEEYPRIADAAHMFDGKGIKANAVAPRPLLAFCYFAFCTVAPAEDAKAFFDGLLEGVGLERGSPVLYARNRLVTERNMLKVNDKIELLFRAWNAHRAGENRVLFRISGGKLPALVGAKEGEPK